jgi:hypothetical protein
MNGSGGGEDMYGDNGDEYPHEQYGGLVDNHVARAARKDEEEPDDNLDEFLKAVIKCKRELFTCIIETYDDQSPSVVNIYTRLLSDIYGCMLIGKCDPESYDLPSKCVLCIKKMIKLYDSESISHAYWLKQMLKVTPYAYNIRGALVGKF